MENVGERGGGGGYGLSDCKKLDKDELITAFKIRVFVNPGRWDLPSTSLVNL